jgi:hypothetical protein
MVVTRGHVLWLQYTEAGSTPHIKLKSSSRCSYSGFRVAQSASFVDACGLASRVAHQPEIGGLVAVHTLSACPCGERQDFSNK